MNSTSDITLALIDAQTPGSTPNLRAAVLFEVVSEFCREVLQLPPPQDFKAPLSGWIPETEWVEHHTAIISGVLARMYVMPNKPWSNPAAAQAHLALYQLGYAKGGAVYAAKELAVNALDRIKAIVKGYIPGLRDSIFFEALFPVADAVARDVLQVSPPAQNSPASVWLSDNSYNEHFTLIVDGVLASLYAQVSQPWGNIEVAKLHASLWMAALPRARERAASATTIVTGYDRLMVSLRVLVPDARDAVLEKEVYNTIHDLKHNVLRQEISPIDAKPNVILTNGEWAMYYRLVMAGTLMRLYAQPGKPWSSDAGAVFQRNVYDAEVAVAGNDNATETATDALKRIAFVTRMHIPTLRNEVFAQALFATTTRLAQDVYQTSAPVHSDTQDKWLTVDQYAYDYNLIVNGVLAYLYAMPGQGWTSLDQSKLHRELFLMEFPRARERAAAALTEIVTGYDRLMVSLRMLITDARDAVLEKEVFNTVHDLKHNVLQEDPPAIDAATDTILTNQEWALYYRLVLAGTLMRLYAQPGKPWSSDPAVVFQRNVYNAEVAIVGNDNAKETASNALRRIAFVARMHIATLRNEVFSQALFATATRVARDVYQTTPPVQTDTQDKWLTTEQYNLDYNLIVNGVLAYLYAMPGQEWTSLDQSKIHSELFTAEFPRARERWATAQKADTGYTRIMMNIRMLVPGMRDDAIHQELFNSIEELQRNVRQLDVPDFASAPRDWLSDTDYKTYFRIVLAGTLYRIYGQSSKPWTDPKAEVAQRAIFEQEVIVARSDAQAADAVNPTDRLLSSLRGVLPGIKDTAIYPELFNVIDEACRQAYIWSEVIRYRLTPNRQTFKITPEGCDVVRVGDVYHAQISDYVQVDPIAGTLTVLTPITDVIAQEHVVVRLLLAPSISSKSEDAVNWIPFDLWGRFHQLLLEGCLHKLMLQPAKPWSDPKMGAVHGQMYRRLLVQATQEIRAGGLIPKRQNWTYPRYTQ